jgi:hypothetical protein
MKVLLLHKDEWEDDEARLVRTAHLRACTCEYLVPVSGFMPCASCSNSNDVRR